MMFCFKGMTLLCGVAVNDPNQWREIFIQNKNWVGSYVYANNSYAFHVMITDHSVPSHVSMIFVEDLKNGAHFELQGD
jgi:hypothetical protein